jgi:hypothetical protein
MPKYHLHLGGEVDRSLTPEGINLVDLEAAKKEALRNAREIMAHDVLMGCLDLNPLIVVKDESGELVHSLALRDALTIAGY